MVEIRSPMYADCMALAQMLNDDKLLRHDLGIDPAFQTNASLTLEFMREWGQARDAISLVILADKIVVGMICFAHIDHAQRSARIGYWIGSSYRRKGFCTLALDSMIQRARKLDLKSLTAQIDSENRPSRRLWERLGATSQQLSDSRYLYELQIDS